MHNRCYGLAVGKCTDLVRSSGQRVQSLATSGDAGDQSKVAGKLHDNFHIDNVYIYCPIVFFYFFNFDETKDFEKPN